jgi:hypothetical protein
MVRQRIQVRLERGFTTMTDREPRNTQPPGDHVSEVTGSLPVL